jgi:hypothetical protein
MTTLVLVMENRRRVEGKAGVFVETQSILAYDIAWLGTFAVFISGPVRPGKREATHPQRAGKRLNNDMSACTTF